MLQDVEKLILIYRNMDPAQQELFFNAVKKEFMSRNVLHIQPQKGVQNETNPDIRSINHIQRRRAG